ncbi:glycosyltransferase family 2 protein [Deinococcus frigens]|uniref:glycosyltransferase family 2 protein n=1 Tax=Deinococcus frigens TaxID=249403 RepID=UPI0004982C88|nr:glycosyltransferase family 2 protein [Deinococcus frigens]
MPDPHPPEALSVAAVIPAYNEAGTVGEVVRVALELTPDVVVASDGSDDDTAAVARAAGARVVELAENGGKGAALRAALDATDADVVVMLDADLTGLTLDHLRRMLRPVLDGTLDMSIGVFEGGRFVTDWGNKLTPHLSGQRVCRREWLRSVPHLGEERWPEPAITAHLKSTGAQWSYVELPQVGQVLKEKKRGFWNGVWARGRMYADLLTFRARRKKS